MAVYNWTFLTNSEFINLQKKKRGKIQILLPLFCFIWFSTFLIHLVNVFFLSILSDAFLLIREPILCLVNLFSLQISQIYVFLHFVFVLSCKKNKTRLIVGLSFWFCPFIFVVADWNYSAGDFSENTQIQNFNGCYSRNIGLPHTGQKPAFHILPTR